MAALAGKDPDAISEGEEFLTFEKAVTLPDVPLPLEWAPDNRHIAMVGYPGGGIFLLDADAPAGSGWANPQRMGPAAFAFSPDGAMLAVLQEAPIAMLRIFDTRSGKEMARRETSLQNRYEGFLFNENPLTFTPDGRSLWITNGRRFPSDAQFPGIALKLDAGKLEAQDRFDTPPLPAGYNVGFDRSCYSFLHDNGSTQMLFYRVESLPWEGNARPLRHYFAFGYDLETKAALFPKMLVAEDNRSGFFRSPSRLFLLHGGSHLLVLLNTALSGRPGIPHHPEYDRLIEVYDLQSGQLIADYFGENSPNIERGAVGNLAFHPNGNLLIGRWNNALDQRGGLVVFEPLTGTVRQRIIGAPVSSIALSPNGRRLALIADNRQVRFYTVN